MILIYFFKLKKIYSTTKISNKLKVNTLKHYHILQITYDKSDAYNNSKLANNYFARKLSEKLDPKEVGLVDRLVISLVLLLLLLLLLLLTIIIIILLLLLLLMWVLQC